MSLKSFFLSIVMGCSLLAFSQNRSSLQIDSLSFKIQKYYSYKNIGTLYAHFDKTVYSADENVWFTGYLLSDLNNTRTNDELFVVLYDKDHHTIITKWQFNMTAGISFGKLEIPDSLTSGDYYFALYNNEFCNGEWRFRSH